MMRELNIAAIGKKPSESFSKQEIVTMGIFWTAS